MPYAHAIAAIDYLSWLLSQLVARLYGKEEASRTNPDYPEMRSYPTGEGEPEERGK